MGLGAAGPIPTVIKLHILPWAGLVSRDQLMKTAILSQLCFPKAVRAEPFPGLAGAQAGRGPPQCKTHQLRVGSTELPRLLQMCRRHCLQLGWSCRVAMVWG